MAIHGSESQARRQRDFIRTELMAHGENIRDAQDQLAQVRRRLDALEAALKAAASEPVKAKKSWWRSGSR